MMPLESSDRAMTVMELASAFARDRINLVRVVVKDRSLEDVHCLVHDHPVSVSLTPKV